MGQSWEQSQAWWGTMQLMATNRRGWSVCKAQQRGDVRRGDGFRRWQSELQAQGNLVSCK